MDFKPISPMVLNGHSVDAWINESHGSCLWFVNHFSNRDELQSLLCSILRIQNQDHQGQLLRTSQGIAWKGRDSLFHSLSHCENRAVLVQGQRPIGVDLERQDRLVKVFPKLKDRYGFQDSIDWMRVEALSKRLKISLPEAMKISPTEWGAFIRIEVAPGYFALVSQ